ncbi:MAG: response regulator [Limisphaerales bacterium]
MTEQKILTVDDDKVIRLIVSTAFRAFACKVFEAGDGVEGLALADREHPDLILLDNDMPVMDGTEMLSRLKASPETRNIPVLMLTGNSQRDSVMRILRLGVKDYLVKPFTPERMLERVSRIIELKAQGDSPSRFKRSDERLQILVVDDKPAISGLIVKGFEGTPWQVQTVSEPGEALEACNRIMPDVLLVSLSLPGGGGFTLFRMLRATPETKGLPILALSVRTAVEEQVEAQQLGFTAVVTKPIDVASLRHKIIRALGLDTSHLYFQQRDSTLLLSLPANFNQLIASEIVTHLREKVCEAVDAGLDRLVIDLSQLPAMDVIVLKLGLDVIQLCSEFGLRYGLIGSEAVAGECAKYQETKDWKLSESFEKALELLQVKA